MNDDGLLAQWQLVLLASKDQRLSRVDVACLMAILDRFNPNQRDAQGRLVSWPGLQKVARDTGANRSSVVRSIGRLVDFAYLERESGNRIQSNRYRIGEPASRANAPRRNTAPRRTAATTGRRGDAPGVGAATRLEVGAATHLELAPLNLPNEPAQLNLPKPAAVCGLFDQFWEAYPRKEAKAAAVKAWTRAKGDRHVDQILADVRARVADSRQWAERRYTPLPATYLNGQRWQDDWNSTAGNSGPGLLPRDRRTDEELEAANRQQLARFGMEDAA